MSELSLKIHSVAARALRDPDFATELKHAALAAVKGGAHSEAFRSYFERFASTPGELASLGTVEGTNCACKSTTFMTISSLVTPVPTCCNTTTTTTTSGNYFGGG
jgi:hypothetical protein